VNEEGDNDNIVEQHRYDQRAAILPAQPAGDANGKQRRATYARDRQCGGCIERSAEQQPRKHCGRRQQAEAGSGFNDRGDGQQLFHQGSGDSLFLFGRKDRLSILLHAHDRPAFGSGLVEATAAARMVFVFIVVPDLFAQFKKPRFAGRPRTWRRC
jgi:hypothetical protein